MQRILVAIGGAAAFCAAVTFLLQLAIARGLPATEIVLVTSSATMLLSLAAAVFAYRAFNRAKLVEGEFERLARSMDAAIKDVSLRVDRDATRLEELNAASGKHNALPAHIPLDADADRNHPPVATAASPVRKGRQTHVEAHAPDPVEAPGVDVALRRMMAGGHPDLSLQPIIAAGRGEAGGFEVHFHVQPEEGSPVDIRRLQQPVADVNPAAFERLAVASAAEAARRGLADISERMPLHIAVSSALLQDGLELAAVLDVFKLHPALAKTIVLSLPAELVESGQYIFALELLSGIEVRMAAEDWGGSQDALDKLKRAGVGSVKVAAERLLDRAKVRKGQPNGGALVEMVGAAGIDIIATDVQSEEDAVSLIEMGVDLMTGQRLSPPRRLKADAPGRRL